MENSRIPPPLAEPLILYLVFFFQGFVAGNQMIPGEIYNNPAFIALTLATAIPPSALVWYLLLTRPIEPVSKLGLGFRAMDAATAVPVYLGIIVPLGAASGILSVMPLGDEAIQPILWQLDRMGMLGFAAVAFVFTAYFEELFFRAYLTSRFRSLGLRPIPAILLAALMFSAGHIYEGVGGLVVSFALGVYFGWVYQRTGRLWPLVIAHAGYNTTVLALSRFL